MTKDTKQKYTVVLFIIIFSALVVWMLTQDIKFAIMVAIASTGVALIAGRLAGED